MRGGLFVHEKVSGISTRFIVSYFATVIERAEVVVHAQQMSSCMNGRFSQT